MAWLRWDLVFSIGLLFVSPAFISADQSGFRKFYVLQPGPSGSDRVHVSSISSRSGAAGQPRSYSVELTASFAHGQSRTRRMGNSQAINPIPLRQDAPFTQQHQQVSRQHAGNHNVHQMKLSGVNVCGGQCCHGWSKAPGSQRCTKPNCVPQCQNGGMCLRPQHCVCKQGSKGQACEQRAPAPASPYPDLLPGNGHGNGPNMVPQRPIPQQGGGTPPQGYALAPVPVSNMRLSVQQAPPPPHLIRPQRVVHQQIRPMAMHPAQSQQFVLKPKYYHTHHTHPQHHQPDRAIPLTVGHSPLHGNHTGRIKVVFTPTICKVTCVGGQCRNNCELGNTTTIISENGHATDTLTAPNFRVVVCHLPCINGGKCSARDKCQCPPSFTGKFCQMAVQNGRHQQQVHSTHTLRQQQTAQVHSTHTLPLTFSNGHNPVKYSPSIVNIHVKHPPEASVQIHQVSQLDANGQKVKGSSSQSSQSSQSHYTTYHHSESSQTQTHQQYLHHQQQQQQGHNVIYPGQHSYVPQYHQPVTAKSQLGRCFQETTGTQCGKALPGLSKQEDCCGTVGTSWGFHKCQKCPKKPSIPLTGSRHAMDCPQGYKRINNSHCLDLNECQLQGVCPNGECLNTMGSYRCSCKAGYVPDPTLSTCIPKFKEICPGGMGYTVLPKPPNRIQPAHKPVITYQEPVAAPLPLPTPEKPVEALSVTERQLPTAPVVTVAPEQELAVGGASHSPVLEPVQPQLSPGVSTVTMGPIFPEVVEKTSPPAPVEILPSNAGQDIAPTQFEEVNECHVNPLICGQGLCYNTAEGYTCICDQGYRLDHTDTTCVDVDECAESPSLCANGRCRNSAGSFLCVCQAGFITDQEGASCIDVDECVNHYVCPEDSFCVNLLGSYSCRHCDAGYRMSPVGQCEDIDECLEPSTCANGKCSNFQGHFACSCDSGFTLSEDGQSCEDVDECQDEQVCTRGHCQNTQGSFLCSCGPGFRSSATGAQCDDVDECVELPAPCADVGQCVNNMGSYQCSCPQGYLQVNGTACEDVDECVDDPDLCLPHGECLNVQGSFHCLCQQGFVASETHTCDDVDECLEGSRCVGGSCENSQGSYRCQCDRGYRLQADNHTCQDIDECSEQGRSICGAWHCENTEGSYRCMVNCPPGHTRTTKGVCVDIDECAADESVCGNHGYCENTVGSFRCMCDSGYQESQDGQGCVDVNECELLSSVCGEALCQNVEGTFLCACPEEDQVYDQRTAKCSPPPTASERKECYYNLNDENLCENVLTSHVTMEECCCTLGAGWGDNCEVHPCPVQGTDQFEQMCPAGRGSVPTADSTLRPTGYEDADECALFGEEICKDGFCHNSPGSYECYCKTGLYYDEVKLQCRDINECLDESNCVGGECLNSEGSYTCFCTHPMVLDPEQKRCVFPPDVAGSHGVTDFQGICWETVTDTMACTKPLANRKTTYTECCCLFGEAWGMECSLCPPKDTEDYATMCNVPLSGGRRPYGRDALVAGETHEYEESPVYGRYEEEDADPFEGLRAEECGILNGCENGWCVRVQEGYTCDCFDGFSLDTSRMICMDVNECSELNNRMSLCKNAKCINTQGSYKCVCLPGFQPSDRPNYCVSGEQGAAAAAAASELE